ncbi:MAG: amidohydrolase family protein [Candidatus Hodarchaeota archaeon]
MNNSHFENIHKNASWNLKSLFIEKVNKNGGWVNCHCHLDKAFLISVENIEAGSINMQEKWEYYANLKKNYTIKDLRNRISLGVELMLSQGVSCCCTHIDVDSIIELKAVEVALEVKQTYKDKIKLLITAHPLQGLRDKQDLYWYEKACEITDLVGGLPSRDRPYDKEHLDLVLQIAKDFKKIAHIHIDQENIPQQKESRLLAEKTLEHNMVGKVMSVHSISLSAIDEIERRDTIELLNKANIGVIVCPGAALSMRPVSKTSRIHNSIAPVPELLENGINIALGTDNIYDFFMPLTTGEMWEEVVQLANASRFYNFQKLVDISTSNGKKLLGLN